jgi:hypothetical protein
MEDNVSKTIKIALTEDEIEIAIDALEADQEGYAEAAKEARANGKRDDVKTFSEAAERIGGLMEKLRAVLPEA